MKAIRNEEEAVSPVIGVILMVAIVVILAAVIAAFVFGMAGSAGTSKNAAVTVSLTAGATTDYGGFEVLWQGGTDIAKINGADYSIPGVVTTPVAIITTNPTVGEVDQVTVTGGFDSGDRLIITATFDDGSTQVIYDRVV